MTPAEDAALRAAAASSPGYACSVGTPVGNPRRIVLPVSWARVVTDPRPLAEITPPWPIPSTVGPLRGRRPVRAKVTVPPPDPEPQTPAEPATADDIRTAMASLDQTVRDTVARIVVAATEEVFGGGAPATPAEIATAAPPAPGEPRRWWHYLTARRPKEN